MGLDFTGIGSVADLAKSVVERFFPAKMTDAEKAETQVQLQTLLQQRENAVMEAQKSIIVAEMQQADNFTKRARPSIVYAGLFFIFLVHVFLPIIAFSCGKGMPALTLPEEFWWAWGGVCSVWVMGRTAEKRGVTGNIIGVITGNK